MCLSALQADHLGLLPGLWVRAGDLSTSGDPLLATLYTGCAVEDLGQGGAVRDAMVVKGLGLGLPWDIAAVVLLWVPLGLSKVFELFALVFGDLRTLCNMCLGWLACGGAVSSFCFGYREWQACV